MGKQQLECDGCGSPHVIIVFIPQYRGYRGTCPECGANWPES